MLGSVRDPSLDEGILLQHSGAALGSLLSDQRCRVIHSVFVSPVPQFSYRALDTKVEQFLSEMCYIVVNCVTQLCNMCYMCG